MLLEEEDEVPATLHPQPESSFFDSLEPERPPVAASVLDVPPVPIAPELVAPPRAAPPPVTL